MIDTSILIDYFRKPNKDRTRLIHHFRNHSQIYISSITEFEIYNGAKESHQLFWDLMVTRLTILDFDSRSARIAAGIVSELKAKRKSIDKPDLFIASTAIANNLTFDTLNTKHFVNIDTLELFTLK